MTEADRIFGRFPPFIREYIYSHGWDSLRQAQLFSARVILESEDNLLLTGATASGKTEAAFFPILADLCENPPASESVSVLYIAPLKSLINDQFFRMEELLAESGIPVTHWHGDVGISQKERLLRNPHGILQITPESLESMLMKRGSDVIRLFCSLRYVIVDEIHTLIGADRGNQILCQLSRLSRLIGHSPRRIGLSATIGDASLAAEWLGADSGRATQISKPENEKLRWRLGFEHFYIQNPAENQSPTPSLATAEPTARGGHAQLDPGYEFLYDAVKDKRALVFSNSREETEYVTATLRQIAKKRKEKDVFLIHHGNLSAALREDAERKMKEGDEKAVTCATVTMELGIDIGRLERVAQVDAPTSVSGFLQRLGRSGRRGAPPEMIEVFREETPLPNTPLPQLIPWGLLRAIAIVELYTGERFVEPPRVKKQPFSLAFHQTLSVLASSGELTAKALADRILNLPPFIHIEKEDYRTLLLSMLENEWIEMTEEKGLIIGLRGERVINSYKFYAVFKDSEDYTVRCESDEIGTITNPPPVGDRFALAGRVWEVTEADLARRLIYVKSVDGKMEISWPGDSGEIHTRLLEKMREILFGTKTYPYLMPNAAIRLENARHLAKNTGMESSMVVSLGGSSFCLFPWLGTRAFRTLRRLLLQNAKRFGISDLECEGCCYMTFKAWQSDGNALLSRLTELLRVEGIDADSLVGAGENPAYDKFDAYIPADLLRRAYVVDRLNPEEVVRRFLHGFEDKREEVMDG
ncbi:MAG: DEAD/DEAH box helicase [Clostridia bacterium]|nr:DEAD/DEAH box helicase [Clostridia bacterium]